MVLVSMLQLAFKKIILVEFGVGFKKDILSCLKKALKILFLFFNYITV